MSASAAGAARPDRAGPGEHTEPEVPATTSLAERVDQVLLSMDRLRDRPLVSVALATLALAALVGGWWLARSGRAEPVEAGIPFVSAPVSPMVSVVPTEAEGPLVVHVAGAVRAPGIVMLAPGSRIVDAIEEAGGVLPEADVHRLNLAAPVADGMQIRVPLPGEAVPVNGSGPVDGRVSGPLGLNDATAAELETLHGIGPALAEAIVQWRSEHGRFQSVDDLLSVPGIGPAKLAALSDLVTL